MRRGTGSPMGKGMMIGELRVLAWAMVEAWVS
jgi:hypothetical protein